MIKLTFCLRRLPQLTPKAFRDYWYDVHGPLVREVAEAMRMRRYVQSHALVDARFVGIAATRGIEATPYDGIAELWWDDVESMLAVGETSEGRAASRRLVADERNFIDVVNSPLFFVNEREVIAR
ncbi:MULTISPECIES: EthD domain-containing protein [unclassified Paraburkholderia]|uniref:EthD domain-containing protein n=1 Tax=unclassified Paraburkholderia TaxID=2615204 RepID=UPI002AB75588|nr:MULTISPECIES: EthD domain-containing protein [unclassified Paraburkholderia]